MSPRTELPESDSSVMFGLVIIMVTCILFGGAVGVALCYLL